MPLGRKEYIRECNLSTYMLQCCSLASAGYGSLSEIQKLDTQEFLDCLEFEEIKHNIIMYGGEA